MTDTRREVMLSVAARAREGRRETEAQVEAAVSRWLDGEYDPPHLGRWAVASRIKQARYGRTYLVVARAEIDCARANRAMPGAKFEVVAI